MSVSRPLPPISNWLFYWLPPLVWTAAILTLSGELGSARNTLGLLNWLLSWLPGVTPQQLQIINAYLRKTGHALAYGSLCVLWFRAFRRHGRYRWGQALLWSLGLCLAAAVLDESHQSFLASRGGSLRDVGLDFFGASLGALAALAWWRWPSRRSARLRPVSGGRPE